MSDEEMITWDLPSRLEFIADWASHPGCPDGGCRHCCRAAADLDAAAAILRSVFHAGDESADECSELDDLVQLAMRLSDVGTVSRAGGMGHHLPVIRKAMHVILAHQVLTEEVVRLRRAIELHEFTVSSYVQSRDVPEPVAAADELLYESLRGMRCRASGGNDE